MFNKDFMWHGSYHQYEDWKKLMEDTYDQFNLLQLPDSQQKYFFDRNFHQRKVPQGIFPFPHFKRTILQKPGALDANFKDLVTSADRFT